MRNNSEDTISNRAETAVSVAGRGASSMAAPLFTVFASSACIMVIELAAGRLVSSYLGQSLYTWTSIIGVILAGIAIGNYAGGRIAARSFARRTIAFQFVLAGILCLSTLAVNGLMGRAFTAVHVSWPIRIFVHIAFVFLLPSAALGSISPVIARRALECGLPHGRTVGNVYAWAIAGSILGAFATGYYLLMVFGVSTIVAISSCVLIAIGAIYAFGAFARREAIAASASDDDSAVVFSGRGMALPIAALFVASMCVMALEVAAGRIMSRQYGQSLYSWTAVILVVLAGMSAGSYFGGRLADRFDPRRMLCWLLLAGSLATEGLLISSHMFSQSVAFIGFSWPVQIAIHAAGTFFIVSVVLGAVSPVAVKAALGDLRAAGRVIGNFYALGSAAGILGTFAMGFWLISALGTVRATHAVAAVLAVTAVVLQRRAVAAHILSGLCFAGAFVGLVPISAIDGFARNIGLRDVAPERAVYVDESQYSYIAVTADSDQPRIRVMTMDHLIHSRVNLDDATDLRYEYEWVYTGVLDRVYGAGRPLQALVIGGGGYTYPRYLEATRAGSRIDVAEIDPAVTEAAHEAFGLPRDSAISISDMDARNFVDDALRSKGARPQYDCILGDSINDFNVPYHLTTLEFNEKIRQLLKDDGVYMLNLIELYDSGRFLAAVVDTCKKTFQHVYVFNSLNEPARRDTFIVVNAQRALDLAGLADGIRGRFGYQGEMLGEDKLAALKERAGGCILTDDFAPVEVMLAGVARTSRETYPAQLLNTANEQVNKGQLDAAIDTARTVLRSGVSIAGAHEAIGAALLKKGDVDGAVEELRTSIALDGTRETAYNNLGSALSQKGDQGAAIEAWNKAVALNPNFSEGHKNLAFALLKLGNLEGAVSSAKKAVDLGMYVAESEEIIGQALLRKGDFDGAEDAIRKSVAANPSRVSAQNALAHVLHKKGDISGAILAWNKAIELKPDFVGAYESLAGVFLEMGELKGAIAQLKKAVEYDPKSSSARNTLGLVRMKADMLDEAIAEFKEVLRIDPKHVGTQQLLALAYMRKGDFDQAWEEVKRMRAAGVPIEQNLLDTLKRASGREE